MTALALRLAGLPLLWLRQPLWLVLAALAFLAHLALGAERPELVLLDAWHALHQEPLLPIPLFLLAGQIVARGETAARRVALIAALTARLPGGLAVGAVLASAVFASVSGPGLATLTAVGTVMYPAFVVHAATRPASRPGRCAPPERPAS
ncbi:MAG: TRAP transporter large permease subunit [Xanthomonadales bacterium]|nr:TRAP transporter large permease subunit [Xanthomonadales bacterium]